MTNIHRDRLIECLSRERERYRSTHQKSGTAREARSQSLLFQAPMNWMQQWPMEFPLTVANANCQTLIDADANRYVDLCLGYSAAFPGHAAPAGVQIHREKANDMMAESHLNSAGSVYLVPSASDSVVGELLKERYGQSYWGFALSATDANRFAIKLCRAVTGRQKILVFEGCYHGTVEETFATNQNGMTVTREGNLGIGVETQKTTTAIEFNDSEALAVALRSKEYACILLEPVMTNCGIIYPKSGFLDEILKLSRETGTISIFDEAHTLTADARGYVKKHALTPDVLVLGKCLGGGFPVGAYGVTKELRDRIHQVLRVEYSDVSGIGGTLTGSPAAMAAIVDTLANRLTNENYEAAIRNTHHLADGMREIITKLGIKWSVVTLGARFDIWFAATPAKNATEAFTIHDSDLYEYVFTAMLNRGYVLSPYWNILGSVSPFMTSDEITGFLKAFRQTLKDICD